jgi:DNA repair protein RadC
MATAVISEIQMGYKPNLISSKIIRIIFGILETVFLKKRILVQEQFVVLYLNRVSKVIGSYQLSKGGIIGTIVDVRLIFSVA